jgi:hypothetical protein
MEEPEGRRPLGKNKCRWKNNINISVKIDGVVWTALMWLGIGTSGGFL